jgi:SAM-dependent methyltransferase
MRAGPDDDSECGRLYDGYRGEKYFRIRNKHEFWYTRKVNDAFADDPVEVNRRREFISEVLINATRGFRIGSILDYGGDRGQIIPHICEDRVSFDVSGVECVPGVRGISSKDELRTYDCVMICHVLEHVADPVSFLSDISRYVTPGGFVLIALPREAFTLPFLFGNRVFQMAYSKYLETVQKVPLVERVLDFYSTAFKVKFNLIPPLGFIKQSEHLTVFNERAIGRMVERAGFEMQGGMRLGFHAVFGKEFVCVCRKKQ